MEDDVDRESLGFTYFLNVGRIAFQAGLQFQMPTTFLLGCGQGCVLGDVKLRPSVIGALFRLNE